MVGSIHSRKRKGRSRVGDAIDVCGVAGDQTNGED